jgi:hypothetical protein
MGCKTGYRGVGVQKEGTKDLGGKRAEGNKILKHVISFQKKFKNTIEN